MRLLLLCSTIACGPKPAPPAPVEPTRPPEAPSEEAPVLGASAEIEVLDRGIDPGGRVELDGLMLDVRWGDGDTFSFTDSSGDKVSARLMGYNTLESYGPVHRWAEWSGWELYGLAKEAGVLADARTWECTDTGGSGGYGRIAVDCPDLREALLIAGMAHVFAIDEPPPAGDLELQQQAIEAGAGMWAKGAPAGLLTSLHSASEGREPYNRVCDLGTGMCPVQAHDQSYDSCEEVCVEEGSCMLYVPYEERYGPDRAACLKP